MATLGDSCIDRTGTPVGNGYTLIFSKVSFPDTSNISSWCAYVSGATNARLKVFRDDGTNWIFVGESALLALSSGLNTGLAADIDVVYGDYIGIYIESTVGVEVDVSTPTYIMYYQYGDISTNTLKSTWDSQNETNMSFQATYTVTAVADVYVNSSTGNDTYAGDSCVAGHPVLTFAHAYSLLASGGNLHICNSGADFSTETVTLNKSFNIDLNGSDGYFYMPQAS
jgi:hypothetical protein